MSRWERLQARRRKDQNGFVAIFTVIAFASFMFGCAALGVDVARWYVEAQRLQRAADAGALGGVTYLPQDMGSATTTANAITTRNGYTNGSNGVTVSTAYGTKKSELQVTVCSTVTNTFGAIFGYKTTSLCRSAVADFTGPAPLGSPCNTFANEPSGGGGTLTPSPSTGTALAGTTTRFGNCSSNPQMWADIEGPQTAKEQGDRFQTLNCDNGTSTDGCKTGTTNNNNDYDKAGYFWLVHVQPAAVGHTIDVQLFDPAFVNTGQTCDAGSMPTPAFTNNSPNDYVTDAANRYTSNSSTARTSWNSTSTCTGDSFPGTSGGSTPMTTSFALRQQTDTLNPLTAAVQTDTSGTSCVRQYAGTATRLSANALTKGASGYVAGLAAEFHNWVSFCKFTPTRSGDYYLQVRSNVALAGTSADGGVSYTGNDTNVLNSSVANSTTGSGANGFSLRAVTESGYENQVSVSAFDKMPIFENATGSTAVFNLIRVLPGAAGKAISFSFYDVGDAASSGTVAVTMPTDATNAAGTITYKPSASGGNATNAQRFPNGCKAIGAGAGTGTSYSDCTPPISNADNNGKLETVSIPIPNDYTCNYNSLGGCWYQVTVKFPAGTAVHDTTTWTADIVGQPVRLIQ